MSEIEMNWNQMATEVLDHTSRYPMAEAHRGAMGRKELGITILFENRGEELSQAQAQEQVRHIREVVAAMGAEILGCDVSADECSWVMLIKSEEVERLDRLAWQAYAVALGEVVGDKFKFNPAQRAIAELVIAEHGFTEGKPPREPDGEILRRLVEAVCGPGIPRTPELMAGLRKHANVLTALRREPVDEAGSPEGS